MSLLKLNKVMNTKALDTGAGTEQILNEYAECNLSLLSFGPQTRTSL